MASSAELTLRSPLITRRHWGKSASRPATSTTDAKMPNAKREMPDTGGVADKQTAQQVVVVVCVIVGVARMVLLSFCFRARVVVTVAGLVRLQVKIVVDGACCPLLMLLLLANEEYIRVGRVRRMMMTMMIFPQLH
jgi:hypothetical protein